FPHAEKIEVVCGRGNNGGDGFVAARKLHEAGKQVVVLLLAEPVEVKGDAAAMLKRLPNYPQIVRSVGDVERHKWAEADLFVDAILGTGSHPPVEGAYALAIQKLNDSGTPIVS